MERIRVIWKYPVQVKSSFTVEIPAGGEVLSVSTVRVQGGEPFMWVMVDPEAPREMMKFSVKVTGTAFEVSGLGRYIGTFQLDGGRFVGHLFEEWK